MYEKDILQIYEVPLDVFETRIRQRREQLMAAAQSDSLYEIAPFWVDNPNFTFVYKSFDDQRSKRS